jgi:hypothetical protein
MRNTARRGGDINEMEDERTEGSKHGRGRVHFEVDGVVV